MSSAAEVVQLPAGTHISPAWLARPVHSPERRHFSVLCWRGWCDYEFRVRAVAYLADAFTGRTRPASELPYHLARKQCPIPDKCQCECHDEKPGDA